jgi:hypothetical protein
MTDLLPCPFCGGKATWERIRGARLTMVHCQRDLQCASVVKATKPLAVELWNTRALTRQAQVSDDWLLPIVSDLNNITREIEDEGDRAYLGSTNDADRLKEIAETLDNWRFERSQRGKP